MICSNRDVTINNEALIILDLFRRLQPLSRSGIYQVRMLGQGRHGFVVSTKDHLYLVPSYG